MMELSQKNFAGIVPTKREQDDKIIWVALTALLDGGADLEEMLTSFDITRAEEMRKLLDKVMIKAMFKHQSKEVN